jgi:signal peptidase I
VITAAVLLGLLGVVRLFALSPFSVPTGSMRPTLEPGDHVLVDRVSHHIRGVRRGDVVVVDGTDLLVTGGRRYVVKRVLGVGRIDPVGTENGESANNRTTPSRPSRTAAVITAARSVGPRRRARGGGSVSAR